LRINQGGGKSRFAITNSILDLNVTKKPDERNVEKQPFGDILAKRRVGLRLSTRNLKLGI